MTTKLDISDTYAGVILGASSVISGLIKEIHAEIGSTARVTIQFTNGRGLVSPFIIVYPFGDGSNYNMSSSETALPDQVRDLLQQWRDKIDDTRKRKITPTALRLIELSEHCKPTKAELRLVAGDFIDDEEFLMAVEVCAGKLANNGPFKIGRDDGPKPNGAPIAETDWEGGIPF